MTESAREYTLITGSNSPAGRSIARRLAPYRRLILQDAGCASPENLANAEAHLIWRHDFEGADTGESLRIFLAGASVVRAFVHCIDERPDEISVPAPEQVLSLFRMNVFSATAIIRALLRKQVNRARLETVVFLSNIAGRFATGSNSIYAAAKGALDSLGRSLAVELAPHVRVNSVLAGEIADASAPSTGTLLGPGSADDISGMVEFLISEKACWITGQQFVVDGGRTAH